MEIDSFKAMNTTIATQGLPERWRALARNWFAFAEDQLSRFRPDSELSRLNRAGGRPFSATPLLYQILEEADRYSRETNGLFSPYLGRALERLGYDDSFEKLDGGFKNRSGIDLANGYCRPELDSCNTPSQYICPAELDPRTRIIRLRPDTSVDLGGVAKGWTARHLAKLARQDGVRTGAVGAGGDLVLWGCPPGGWQIGIVDPWQATADRMTLTLRKGAGIATSSAMKRRWTDKDGAVRHHIVDPRTGTSARTDLAQVTVIAPDAVMAEVYAKCVLLLGAEAGSAWLVRENPRCAMVGILQNGSLLRGGDLEPFAAEEGADYERIG